MNHISTLRLHQLRLGELAPAEEGQVRAHLADCALCMARTRHQAEVRQEFLRQPMPAALEPHVSLWERLRGWLPAAALVPAALAAVFVMRVGPAPEAALSPERPAAAALAEPVPLVEATPTASAPQALPSEAGVRRSAAKSTAAPAPAVTAAPAAPEAAVAPEAAAAPEAAPEAAATERSKGLNTRLEAWVQNGSSARPLYLGETLGAGARVQLRYDARGKRFVTLAGRDSNGLVEVYATLPVKGEGLVAAPFALTLDESAGEQTFFAVYTDAKPTPESVKAAVGQNPVRMDGAVVSSVVLRKD